MYLTDGARAARDTLLSTGLKECTHCEKVLPVSAFSRASDSLTGLRSWCKACIKAWRSARREQRAEYNRQYWRRKHEECLANQRCYLRQWRKKHPEENRERQHEYRKAHPDAVRRYEEEYRRNHQGQIATRAAKYRQTENGRAKGRGARSRRRARLAGLMCSLTEFQWQAALSYFDNCCAYCGASNVVLAQEHVVPLTRGGAYIAANIVPACKSCNSSKNDASLDEWASGLGAARVQDGAMENIRAYLAPR